MRGRELAAATALVAALVLAVLVLAVLGASTGPAWRPDRAPLPEVLPPAPTATAVERPSEEVSDDGGERTAVMDVPGEVLAGLGIVLVGLLLAAMLRLLVRMRGAEAGDEAPRRPVEPAPGPAEPAPDVAALRAGAARAQGALERDLAPGDAVIAAWLAVEEAAAASGVPRAPSQTSTELTTTVLAATDADPAAVRTLLRLYHRARYGMGEAGRVTPADVATARACLDRLARAWVRA